jgi:uncharacterized protein (DUF697 family)
VTTKSVASLADTETNTRTADALGLVKRYMFGSLGVGIVPVPLADMALLTSIQVKMLHSLAALYGTPFSSGAARTVIAGLVGGGVSVSLTSLLVPLGQLTRMAGMSVFAGASTYAIGRVFIQDFESGGKFLSLDPEQVKSFYERQFDNGKDELRKSWAGVQP